MSFLAKTGGANVDRLALENIEFVSLLALTFVRVTAFDY
jgi:hypothetical protein